MYPTLFRVPGVAKFAEDIDAERAGQLAKFGDQHHPDGTGMPAYQYAARRYRDAADRATAAGLLAWRDVLLEEVYEALAEKDPAKLRTELVQVAAVCAAWVSDIDRRPATEEQPTPTVGHTHKLGNPDDDGLLDDWDNCRDPECPGPAITATTQTEAAGLLEHGWVGATELASDRAISALAATGLVGYRQNSGRWLHCLAHKPAPASRYADFHEVTADDLDDGGVCVHPRCGRDLLASWPGAHLMTMGDAEDSE